MFFSHFSLLEMYLKTEPHCFLELFQGGKIVLCFEYLISTLTKVTIAQMTQILMLSATVSPLETMESVRTTKVVFLSL